MIGDQTVEKRAVFFIGGYDPKSAQEHFAKMQRELERFEALWGAQTRMSPVTMSPDGIIGSVTIDTRGQGWAVETKFHFIELDTMVRRDFARPLPVRVMRYLAAFLDFVQSGVLWRMFRTAWRFAMYFLIPFSAIVVFALLGVAAGVVVARTSPVLATPAGIVAGLVTYALAQRFIGTRWPINHLMDLWSFSGEYIHGRRPDAAVLIQSAADAVVALARKQGVDELLLIGHSTGGALILDLAARCLATDPDFPAGSRRTCILTLGSTALKVGMHPAAVYFRQGVQTIVDDRRIDWVDIQCMTDMINFYRSDPVVAMRLKPRTGEPFPLVQRVRIKHMVSDATYRRIRRNFLRLHYQYVFGNTKANFYDFFMICCGPLPLKRRMTGGIVGAGPGNPS